jgi:hypothetical protein
MKDSILRELVSEVFLLHHTLQPSYPNTVIGWHDYTDPGKWSWPQIIIAILYYTDE